MFGLEEGPHPAIGFPAALYQVFLLDPTGVKVELTFDVDEINSVEDELLLDD